MEEANLSKERKLEPIYFEAFMPVFPVYPTALYLLLEQAIIAIVYRDVFNRRLEC